jgi:ribonuclease P protein subunit RPR2
VRTGRRGRRTGTMVRIARERVSDLFALAEREAGGGHVDLADRYVRLARRIGMRYNVRIAPEYRELFCRGCSGYWIEGRTVRTRMRSGCRVRVCLRCGRTRRVRLRPPGVPVRSAPGDGPRAVPREDGALAGPLAADEDAGGSDDESEDE